MIKTCACGCPKDGGDFEGMCGCPAQEVCLCMPGCEYCDNPNVPAPWAAADAAATRLQAWLDAVREHGRRDTGYPDEADLVALLVDRTRMAAELEQVRGERDAFGVHLTTILCGHRLGTEVAALLDMEKAHQRGRKAAKRPADGRTGTGEGLTLFTPAGGAQQGAEGDGEVEV